MDKDYYRKYATYEREHWWFLARKRILLSLLKKRLRPGACRKILNVGSATGASSEFLAELGEVTSLEYDFDSCAYMRGQGIRRILSGSVETLPFEDGAFDLVCAFDVIEHVDDDRKAVEELNRVCAPGATVCVTVPSFQFLWSTHDEVNHHKRRYTYFTLKRLLQSIPTENHFLTYFNSILFPAVAAYRLASRLHLRHETKPHQSDFDVLNKNKVLNAVLYYLFVLDVSPIWMRIPLPMGTSLLGIWENRKIEMRGYLPAHKTNMGERL